jgi:hypothetical protein
MRNQEMNTKAPLNLFLLLVLLLCLLLGGCGQVAGVQATPTEPAVTATSTPEPEATSTPLPPSATPTSTPTDLPTSTPTPLPSPTADRTAAAQVKASATAEALAELMAPDLEEYGVDPSEGHPVWYSGKSIKIELSNYMENKNRFLEEVEPLSDFVIQSRVTWDTSGALSLCGITYNAGDDFDLGKQNRFFLMRLQFAPQWTIWRWEYNRFQSFLTGSWHTSGNIHDKSGSSNLITLVARDKNIAVYINGTKQRQVEDTQHAGGWLALSAFQESGSTICKFDQTWVWAFDQ